MQSNWVWSFFTISEPEKEEVFTTQNEHSGKTDSEIGQSNHSSL